MSERKYYCFCEANCKFETMTKEQILAAIAQAATTGLVYDPDAAVVSKVKESNTGGSVTFWVGTQAQYNALENVEPNCMYIITDDTSKADMEAAVKKAADDAGTAAAQAAEAKSAAAAAAKAASEALPKAGGEMTGSVTLKGIFLTENVDYGKELPTDAPKGKLFFKEVTS